MNKKKRYWVFCAPNYYPRGGMNDFKAAFDTVHECTAYIKGWGEQETTDYMAHIYDSVEDKYWAAHEF